MVRFLLNGRLIELDTNTVPQLTLDWLRQEAKLTGTKEGCREGDCGACMVLLGQRPCQVDERSSDQVAAPAQAGASLHDPIEWLPVTSCILAVAELNGKHLITIEGLAAEGPTAVMLALHEENASQCGFCSPGVVIALTGRLLQGGPLDEAALKRALEGNLCRCTGYASIHRSAAKLARSLADIPRNYQERIAYLVDRGVLGKELAGTLFTLPEPLGRQASPGGQTSLEAQAPLGRPAPQASVDGQAPQASQTILPLGGGTDWFVKHSETEGNKVWDFIDTHPGSRRITTTKDGILIGASVTMGDFFNNKTIRQAYPGIEAFEDLVASPGIRSRATLAGNIANASPVADMTAMLLALDARLMLRNQVSGLARTLELERFFTGYKKTAATEQEEIESILLPRLKGAASQNPVQVYIHFEKAAKRERLDIAAVNTAIALLVEQEPAGNGGPIGAGAQAATGTQTASGTSAASCPLVKRVRISAGGVAPIPLLLRRPPEILEGQVLTSRLVFTAAVAAGEEISPISDVRGSAEYRREALYRLILAHFITLFPHIFEEEALPL
jgi:xanthine dehydrogenase small subunit